MPYIWGPLRPQAGLPNLQELSANEVSGWEEGGRDWWWDCARLFTRWRGEEGDSVDISISIEGYIYISQRERLQASKQGKFHITYLKQCDMPLNYFGIKSWLALWKDKCAKKRGLYGKKQVPRLLSAEKVSRAGWQHFYVPNGWSWNLELVKTLGLRDKNPNSKSFNRKENVMAQVLGSVGFSHSCIQGTPAIWSGLALVSQLCFPQFALTFWHYVSVL